MRRVILVSFLTALVVAPAASAGGWWSGIEVERSRVAVGQRVTAEAEVLLGSRRAAAAAADEGRFYVYLLRDFDYSVVERTMRKASPPSGWWSIRGAEAVNVGRVALDVVDANLAVARASFTVPEIRAGTYALMFCDSSCARPLADVVPTRGFTVVTDPATVAATERIERLENRLERQARALAAARAALTDARAEAERTRSDVQRLDRSIEDNASSNSGWAYAGWLLSGACATALFGFLVFHRRRPGGVASGASDARPIEHAEFAGGAPPRTPVRARREPVASRRRLARRRR